MKGALLAHLPAGTAYFSLRNSSMLISKLAEDSMELRWPNLTPTVDWNCDAPTVPMNPAFVASRLALKFESKTRGNTAKLLRPAARHERWR